MRRLRGKAYQDWKRGILAWLKTSIAAKQEEKRREITRLMALNMSTMSGRTSTATGQPPLTEESVSRAAQHLLSLPRATREAYGITNETVIEAAKEMLAESRLKKAPKPKREVPVERGSLKVKPEGTSARKPRAPKKQSAEAK